MKQTSRFFGPILAFHVVMSVTPVLAHAGHGDEFQATGGVNRVEVKVETDSLLGIQVTPIEATTNASSSVFVPVTALVDDNGQQLVFVQYENFYEPVPVMTGVTQGELIEVTDGLSLGEQLVTQGSLSLYAESRKTQMEETAARSEAIVTSPANNTASIDVTEISQADEAHEQAHTDGVAHRHGSSGLTLKNLIGGGIGLVIVGGAIALALTKRNDKGGAL